jgi:hypothetical protein
MRSRRVSPVAKFDYFEKGKQPDYAIRSHATMRVHHSGERRRFEVGFRISYEMEKHLLKKMLERESLRALARSELKR